MMMPLFADRTSRSDRPGQNLAAASVAALQTLWSDRAEHARLAGQFSAPQRSIDLVSAHQIRSPARVNFAAGQRVPPIPGADSTLHQKPPRDVPHQRTWI